MCTAIRSRAILTGLACALAAAACAGDSPTDPAQPPVALQVVSGDQQQGIVGQELPAPLVVKVVDARGHPVRGQIVNFHVTAGGGSVYAGDGLTNSSGIAQDYWTLGPESGPNVLEVRAVDPSTGAKQNFGTFTATALPQTFVLQVSATSGRVVSTPAGIDCGTDCSENYVDGTVVSLTAIPDPGFLFTDWGGDCSGTGACSVTMDSPKEVSASFAAMPPQFLLSVGAPNARVVSSPVGIDCGNDCSESYASGTVVALTLVTVDPGFIFTGWAGDCTGTSGVCTVTMDADRTVTALTAPWP